MPIQDNHADIFNGTVDRIQQEYTLDPGGERVDSIKDGRHVHQQHGEYVINVLDIPVDIPCQKITRHD